MRTAFFVGLLMCLSACKPHQEPWQMCNTDEDCLTLDKTTPFCVDGQCVECLTDAGCETWHLCQDHHCVDQGICFNRELPVFATNAVYSFELDTVLDCMNAWPDDNVVILVHANSCGHFADNLSTAFYTGESLQRRLERAGVERSRIAVVAYGNARVDDLGTGAPPSRYLLELIWQTDGWCNEFPGCPAGSSCVGDRCRNSCDEDTGVCPDDWVCHYDECVMCREDEQCGPGRRCIREFCVECLSNVDCPLGTHCDDGTCREPEHGLCQNLEDCDGEGVLCVEGMCQETCQLNGLGYCHQTPAGIWGIQLRNIRIGLEMAYENELTANWFVSFYTADGALLTWSPDSYRDEYYDEVFIHTEISTEAMDLNGDGIDELWVEISNDSHEVGESFVRQILTFDGSELASFAPDELTDPWLEDIDEDGRLDLITLGQFVAVVAPSCEGGHYGEWIEGPEFAAHNNGDGHFDSADQVALNWLRTQCPSVPDTITDFRDIACGRVYGLTPDDIVSRIECPEVLSEVDHYDAYDLCDEHDIPHVCFDLDTASEWADFEPLTVLP